MDLAPQEERIVLGHLESCESCAKFHHQLQQVILAAEEVPLPDEMLPGKEEQLARMIMQQLPAAKASPFAFLDAIFTKFKNGKQAPQANTGGSMFPHRSGGIRELDSEQTDSGKQMRGTRTKQQQDEEEHAGTNSRLKAMKSTFDSEALYESTREAQSRTLGEKFGMAAPSNSVDDQPLTLAESIRRKISDSAKPAQADEVADLEETEDEAMPAIMPAQVASSSGPQSPIQAPQTPIGTSFAPPDQSPAPGPASAWTKTTPIDGGSWTPSGQTGTGANTDWGGATTGGAPASFAPGQEKPKGSWGPSGWDNAGSTAASKSNEWGGAPQDGFDTAKVQVPAGWGQQPATSSPVQPIAAGTQAQAPAPMPPPSPAPQPKPAPAQMPAPQAPATPGFAQSGPGWGVSPTSTTPAGGASADPWGGSAAADDSWGGAASQKGWGTTDSAKAPTGWGQTATPAASSWGQSAPQPPAQQALPPAMPPVVQPQIPASPPAPPAVQAPSHDWASTKPQGAWGTPTDANEWGAPTPAATMPQASAAAPVTHEAKPAWSLEAEQIETGTWRAFSPGAEALGARPAAPAMKHADPLAGPKEDDRWSTPIQDRAKGGGAAPTNPGFAPPAMPAPALFQPPAPAPAAKTATEEPPSHSKSGWNFPVYEPDEALNDSGWGAPSPVAQAPAPLPSAPPVPPQQSGKPALPLDSIMDKLGTVLSDAAKSGPSSPTPSSWDLSIQEKQLQKAQEPAQFAPDPAPQSTPADWSDEQPATPFPTNVPDNSQWGGFAQNNAAPASFVPGVAPPASFVPGVAAPAAPSPSAGPDKKSLFKLDDSAIDKLFNENLGVKDQAIPPRGAAPIITPPPAPAPTAWEQGSWSQAAAPTQTLGSDTAGAPGWSPPQEPREQPSAPSWDGSQPQNIAATAPSVPVPASAAPQAAPGWGGTAQAPGSNWGNQSPEPAAQPQPAPDWGNPPQAPAAPQPAAGWTNTPQTSAPPAASGWGNTPPAQTPQAAQAPQPGSGWGNPAPEPPALPAAAQSWGAESAASAAPIWGATPEPQAAANWPAPAAPPAPQSPPAVPAPQATPGWGVPPQPVTPAPGGDQGPKISGVTARGAGQSPPGNGFAGQDRRESGQFSAPSAPEPAANKDKQGLFDLDDSAMDQLFRQNLGVEEASTSVTGPPAEPAPIVTSSMVPPPPPGWTPPPIPPVNQPQSPGWPQPAPASAPPAGGWNQPAAGASQSSSPPAPQVNQGWAQPPQPQSGGWGNAGGGGRDDAPNTPPPEPPAQQPPAPPAKGGGLFAIDDNVIDKIFADNLGVTEQQGNTMPKSNAPQNIHVDATPAPSPIMPAPQPTPQPPQPPPHVTVPPPKIEGIGRLDSRVDNSAEQGSGRIASIGKFLLDQKDLEKITKLTDSDLSDSSMRILTTEAAQELNTLLHHIGTLPSVVGSVIVGHDGLLIANTMPQDIEAESIGQWAMGIYMNTTDNIIKMNQKRVHQIVGKTPRGYIVIADFGGGLLVTISDGQETDTLIPLLRSITQLVAQ
jgi:predicted regulator of Ras-like GTPase activity (Roadblock/LC7/MglB family)